jgi:hypothetical protein
MPRVIETKVYKFEELSKEAKEKAREWFRERGFDYDWYDGVEEDFKTICKIVGITDVKIYFSGFYSQGEGACFEGSYHYAKDSVKKLMEYAPQDKELHRIVKELRELQRRYFYRLEARVKHSGHYYHKYCTNIDVYYGDDAPNSEAEGYLKELLRALMGWLYRTLEKEYNYLNSDEQVDETIKINEYEFTEDGKRQVCIH